MAGWRDATLLLDEARFGAAAEQMVAAQLAARGIADQNVLTQMRTVPRHRFIDPPLVSRAYEDSALPTMHGQTISQPYVVALMTAMLEAQGQHRVLEVGTGSGYQTLICARLAARVVSVERDADLSRRARRVLNELQATNVSLQVGDGSLGWPGDAPYDRILVTAAAPDVPDALCDQLADGGRLVIPIGGIGEQSLVTVMRNGDRFDHASGLAVRFVPLVGEQGFS